MFASDGGEDYISIEYVVAGEQEVEADRLTKKQHPDSTEVDYVYDPVEKSSARTIPRAPARSPMQKFLDADNALDKPLMVPPLWRSLGVTQWPS
jgi:YD repeat-containing protein